MSEKVYAERPGFRIDSNGNYATFLVGIVAGIAVNSGALDDNGRDEYFDLEDQIDGVVSRTDSLSYTRGILEDQDNGQLKPRLLLLIVKLKPMVKFRRA